MLWCLFGVGRGLWQLTGLLGYRSVSFYMLSFLDPCICICSVSQSCLPSFYLDYLPTSMALLFPLLFSRRRWPSNSQVFFLSSPTSYSKRHLTTGCIAFVLVLLLLVLCYYSVFTIGNWHCIALRAWLGGSRS